jgi:trehalose 6-phosphate phosphatase
MSRPISEAWPELEALLQQAPQVLLGLDFDGTLAPIASIPSDVRLDPKVREMLCRLAATPRCSLAIVSGRNRNELQTLVGVPDIFYAGNHGLDVSGPGTLFVEPAAAARGNEMKLLSDTLAVKLRDISGTLVENKGLTISVHYRNTNLADRDEIKRIVHMQLANADHPFLLTAGHMVHDIRPRTSWNKGSALLWIKQQLGWENAAVIYVGDDVTDEDAFAALAGQFTVGVGEKPDSSARWLVDDCPAVHALLRKLVDWLVSGDQNRVLPHRKPIIDA